MKITTARLILREFVFEDWPTVLAYQSDPRYLRYYSWLDREPEEVQQFVQAFIDNQRVVPRIKFQLAITLKLSTVPHPPPDPRNGGLNGVSAPWLIGNCGIRQDHAEAKAADIGYELAPAFWGNGYATEAARAMLKFGFRELGVERIWAWCNAENRASAHVLEKLGMHLARRIVEDKYFKDRWWDTLEYEILHPEWEAGQQDRKQVLC
jgi:RimJ/RimL family protein N-acetyltransferase